MRPAGSFRATALGAHVPLAARRVDRVVFALAQIVELVASALCLEAVVYLDPRAVAIAQLTEKALAKHNQIKQRLS